MSLSVNMELCIQEQYHRYLPTRILPFLRICCSSYRGDKFRLKCRQTDNTWQTADTQTTRLISMAAWCNDVHCRTVATKATSSAWGVPFTELCSYGQQLQLLATSRSGWLEFDLSNSWLSDITCSLYPVWFSDGAPAILTDFFRFSPVFPTECRDITSGQSCRFLPNSSQFTVDWYIHLIRR